jgi:hypothetical protein
MILRLFRASMMLTLRAVVAAATLAAGNATFRVIYTNQGYGPGAGLIGFLSQ